MPNIWVIVIIVLSSFIKGVTGFGFTLLSFPLLLIWFSPKEIIPVLMICNLIASVLIVLQKKEYKLLDRQSFYLIAAGGLFTIAGVVVLSATDGEWLVKIAGLVFIILTIASLILKKSKGESMRDRAYLSAGACIGFFAGAVSISGPPLVLFLNKIHIGNRKFREIFAAFSVVTAVIAIIGYFKAGLLDVQTIKMAFIFVPILILGTSIGKKLNTMLSIEKFQTINIGLTLIASILMIVN